MIEKFKHLFWQFFKFGLVGISGTIVNQGTYILLILAGCDKYIANIIGYIISVFSSYLLQSKFVFTSGEHTIKRLARVYLGYLPGLALSTLLIGIYTHFGVPKIWAGVLTIPFTVPLNFFVQKKWAYKE